MYAILIHEAVGSINQQQGSVEGYIKTADVDAFDGRGDVTTTHEITLALKFNSTEKAMEFWRQPSTVRPVREDGKPNRPLCAFTVEIVPINAH